MNPQSTARTTAYPDANQNLLNFSLPELFIFYQRINFSNKWPLFYCSVVSLRLLFHDVAEASLSALDGLDLITDIDVLGSNFNILLVIVFFIFVLGRHALSSRMVLIIRSIENLNAISLRLSDVAHSLLWLTRIKSALRGQ